MITTQRLTLEPLTTGHADQLFHGLADPALYSFIPSDPPASVQSLRQKYTRILRGPQDDSGQLWRNWAVRMHAGEYVGYVETSVSPHDHAYLAYFIFPSYQRRGYAREACETVFHHLQREYGIRRVVAEMDTRNVASWKLLESMGFLRVSEKQDADHFKGATSHEYRYELPLQSIT